MNPRIYESPRSVAWPSTVITAWIRERVVASGGDPAVVPDEPFTMLRRPEVQRRVGLSGPTIYRRIKAGTFPAPIALDEQPARSA